jgi:hypothetical protein
MWDQPALRQTQPHRLPPAPVRYLYRLLHQRLLLPRVTSGEARRRNVTLVGLHAVQAQMWRD